MRDHLSAKQLAAARLLDAVRFGADISLDDITEALLILGDAEGVV